MFKGTFTFETMIEKPLPEVWCFFQSNENLVNITTYPKIELLGDKGMYKGAVIHLNMQFYFASFEWKGEVINIKDKEFFVDVANVLPFPLKEWKHVHSFEKLDEERTKMVDTVQFESYIPSVYIKAGLYGMFHSRKKQLKKHLEK
ncbi:hypothetical protein LGQ02_07830 [Bacillus shivajii]|uniref:SRPBCC family protein n=1 Tax=Bacillus shivajii TaxID=1983719 RepID=UPI001CFB85BE|nr:hypothetical protein [Bacillus shivajii]UCZ54647.1 hypothetical protein LGQ02_07830 [Bacillus shivajii]